MLTRMAELMFVEAIRHYLEESPARGTGWLAGLSDPVVGPALSQLHSRPVHSWTLADLARTVASSRSVLAQRFTALVGISPIQYLTRWRLQLAAEQLATSGTKIATIGAKVGYDSEAAFSRAFKRETRLVTRRMAARPTESLIFLAARHCTWCRRLDARTLLLSGGRNV